MNPLNWSFRQSCLFGLLVCGSLLGFALFVQYQMFLDPCPLCILQRVAFMVMGLGFLLGALLGGRRSMRWTASAIVILGGSGGIAIAGRHVWLQSLPPDQVPACGPGLNYMLEVFPWRDVLAKVFYGSGECAKVDWSFLGISMPSWSLIWYVLLLCGLAWALRTRSSRG